MVTVGSLFAGIGGFDLGFERAGYEIRWQVEIDPWARAVLAKHWPHVHRHDDIRTAGAHNLEAVDVLCGGFPCQDISLAGKGAGIADGTRSGLWSEYARLIRELRPRYVVVENVSALLARGLGRVLGDLAACGYDAEWDCIPAAAVGAPHRRDRLWLVAYPKREPVGHESITESRRGSAAVTGHDGPSRDVADAMHHGREWCPVPEGQGRQAVPDAPGRGGAGTHVAHTSGLRCDTGQASITRREGGPALTGDASWAPLSDSVRVGAQVPPPGRYATEPPIAFGPGAARSVDRWAEQWAVEPNVGRVAHGVPARVDRLRGLGNAIVPQIAEWIANRINDAEARRLTEVA